MSDKYYVYRPLLDLIGLTEGTDQRRGGGPARGYNETLAYGRLTGGDVDLVSMTLTQIDALQTRMLQHKQNIWNSSAVGRYQIVRTTLRSIRRTLPDRYRATRLYDADCQDEMACFLLGQRGIDKYLAVACPRTRCCSIWQRNGHRYRRLPARGSMVASTPR